jgi:hypothetical protein
MMQNPYTSEHQASIVIESRHAEARHEELLRLARAGRPSRDTGAALATIDRLRTRLGTAIRPARTATTDPACQPGMAC